MDKREFGSFGYVAWVNHKGLPMVKLCQITSVNEYITMEGKRVYRYGVKAVDKSFGGYGHEVFDGKKPAFAIAKKKAIAEARQSARNHETAHRYNFRRAVAYKRLLNKIRRMK